MTASDAASCLDACLWLTHAIGRTRHVEEIYDAALGALERGLGVSRSSVLLFDEDGVMRFKAWRGLSLAYRQAVEGHTPWTPDAPNPVPIVVSDVAAAPDLAALLPVFRREKIAALAFIPLVSRDRVIGKFMLYYEDPQEIPADALRLAAVLAAEVAFSIERTRAQARAERSEERLRFALEAARMGTWEWDFDTGRVQWSETLERIHGAAPGSFAGTFDAFKREIHPDDADRVLESARHAVETGTPHEVEYRVVAADGSVRWVEGKGRVEYAPDGRPVRLAGVCMDVTRRKRAELERLSAAQEANQLKDEFLAVLSHELRTPLSAIVGWLQVIQTGGLSAERVREAMTVIERNAALQAQLIDQILDVSRIITGKFEIQRKPVLVPALIGNAINAVTPAAIARGVVLDSDVPHGLPPLEGDPERLLQVLNNLLTNALKFTPAGGRVSLACTTADGQVRITVTDTGAGIAAEFLPYVFERFRQADGSTTRAHGGLGLGLAIARHLVELHGGTIQAASNGPGQGSQFTVALPAAAFDGTMADQPVSLEDSSLAAAVKAHDALRGRRVLVVDDEPDARDLLTALFTEQGSLVAQAGSAREAVEQLQQGPFHMLVADIGMPQTDGYSLIREVRRFEPAMPAIAVTAYARPEDRARALRAGFNAFHSKPFSAAALIRTARDLAEGASRRVR